MAVLVIYNPAAGGSSESRLSALISELKKCKFAVETYQTSKPGDATEFLQQRTEQDEAVVAVGGDGTTREVINGLPKHTPLAVFANGTANVLANELNLPRSAKAIANMIKHANTKPIQFGLINNSRFCMWVGIGFDAWVVAKTNLALKSKVGKLAYAISMFNQALRYGRYQYQIEVDSQQYISYSAVITHAKYYGGRFVISQKANLLTPKLHVLLFQKPSRWFFFKALFALVLGKMEDVDGVISVPFDTLQARCLNTNLNQDEQKLANVLQADGDVVGQMPLEITLDTQEISVLVNS